MVKLFHLSVYTPKQTFYNGEVKEINIEIANGYIGILPDHVPIISSIKPSKFLIRDNKKLKISGVISGGILYFDDNKMRIFTTGITWADEIEKIKVKNNIEELSEKLKNSEISEFERKRLSNLLKYYQLQL